METGHFYYIKNSYYERFSDNNLLVNKPNEGGRPHDRPCFYAFESDVPGIYWVIPFSSQVSKYKRIYDTKIARYKRCDTIVFGEVLGHEKAFLIQNMCPVTDEYIKNEYFDSKMHIPVRVDRILEKELSAKARRVLALHKKGSRLLFADIDYILDQLKSDAN